MNQKEESKLQNNILTDLRNMSDTVCFKVESPTDNGVPDIFFTNINTGSVFIEVKKPVGGVASKAQNTMNKLINKYGCKSYFCKTWGEWVDIKAKLKLK